MKSKTVLFFLLLVIVFSVEPVFAQRGGRAGDTLEVRLASPLPRSSDWGRTLDRIAGEWARVTNNAVRLRVIHDGLEGGDTRMLSSLNTNSIQAALFTSAAIAEFAPSIMTLSVPFMIRDNDEFDLVLQEALPFLEEQVADSNVVVITWAKGGWVYIFSREPVFTPEDLRRQRLSSSPELRDINTTFRTMGFNLVETDVVDLGTRLANNIINAIYMLPEAIAPLGLHRSLRNFLDLPIAPFVGAIVINRVTWNRISPENQIRIINVTRNIASEFDAHTARTAASAVAAMQRDGLTVNVPTPQQREFWQQDINRAMPQLLGGTFDPVLYQRITMILENHRNGRQ